MNGIKIFSGNANRDLAEKICAYLNIDLGKALVSTFSDGESRIEIHENVRGKHVFIIQPTCPPVDTNLMQLIFMIDALKRASAGRIAAVMTYYGYARQERKVKPRTPISAKAVANLLTATGASKVLTMDLHAGAIQGFFEIPVDNLQALPVQLEYIKTWGDDNIVVVSPDAGGVERAREMAKRINATVAFIDKRRDKPNKSKVMHLVGDVKGKNAVLLDDMIDTGGTTKNGAEAIMEAGANKITACCTFPICSGKAFEKLATPLIQEIIVTDAIPLCLPPEIAKKTTILSVAPLFGEAIKRTHKNMSVSDLFPEK